MRRLLILVIILNCLSSCFTNQKENTQLSVQESLSKLPICNMSDICADICNGNMEKIQIDTIQKNVIFRFRKETDFSQFDLYVVVHKDTLGGHYLSLIHHKQTDSLFCQTKMKLSDYSIRLFYVKDGLTKEISQNFISPAFYKGYAEIIRQKTKTQIIPIVYQDSIVLSYNKKKLVYRWLDNNYILAEYESRTINDFEQADIRTTDDDFTVFYKQFVKSILNKDTGNIIAQTLFPILATVDYFDENYEMKDSSFTINTDNFHNYFWVLEKVINYNENSTDNLYIPLLSSYATNKIGNISICEQSLVFEIGTQYGQEMISVYFIKLNGNYKLAKYYSYSINHPGE